MIHATRMTVQGVQCTGGKKKKRSQRPQWILAVKVWRRSILFHCLGKIHSALETRSHSSRTFVKILIKKKKRLHTIWFYLRDIQMAKEDRPVGLQSLEEILAGLPRDMFSTLCTKTLQLYQTLSPHGGVEWVTTKGTETLWDGNAWHPDCITGSTHGC